MVVVYVGAVVVTVYEKVITGVSWKYSSLTYSVIVITVRNRSKSL